jgi:opacity protein-like surface antigen
MSKHFFLPSIVFCLFYSFQLCHSQESRLSFADRLSEWKKRANAHEDEVALLLSQPPLPRLNFALPERPNTFTSAGSFPPEPQVDLPFIPVPDYIEEEPSDRDEPGIISEPPISADVDSESNRSLASQQGVDDAYAELYDTGKPMKHEGFYLGLVSGILFPSDVLLRETSGTSPSHPNNLSYVADTGYMVGLQVGHDFGFVKAEADYSYHNFDASGVNRTLEASIHNIFSRLILERALNDKIDIRMGLGMGMGIVDIEGTTDYQGTGFAYDFLLGAGYRLSHDLSLQIDYRYYLTSASEDFDHVKSHMLLLSAHMDL